ncbi:hypothetical protein FB451DRAFT_1308378 [Mycena latifolia]|nr:hypothetical protein FB451DRAFT_1308378 [Mycena latifolia]
MSKPKVSHPLETDDVKRARRLEEITLRLQAIRQERQVLARERDTLEKERHAALRAAALEALSESEHLAPIPPIHRVPVETLISIFRDAVDSHLPKIGSGTVLVLSQVDKHWRSVAYNLPEIWSSFEVHISRKATDMQLVQLYLHRSRGALLTVHVATAWAHW